MRIASQRRIAPDLARFTIATGDVERGRVRAILRAHLAHESTQTLRRLLVDVLAALGGLLAVCVLLPDAVSVATRRTLLGIWAVCALSAVVAAVLEWRLRREEGRLLAADDGYAATERE